MTPPTLGVLITYHNEGELLRECVASFLAQDPPPDEILIFDDASSAPAEDHVPENFFGRVLHSAKNIGPACARNVLWRESRSEFIHFHDADDIVLPGWGARVRAALAEGAEVVFTEIRSRREGKIFAPEVIGLRQLAPGSDLVRFNLEGALLTCVGTYRRSLVMEIGGYRESLWQSEDFEFHVRLSARLMASAAVPAPYRLILDPLVEIRIRRESRSQDFRRVWSDGVVALEMLSKELPVRYLGDLAEAGARIGAQLFRVGAREEARHAFAVAAQWGTPLYANQGRWYRWVARHWGPERAELLSKIYQRSLPTRWRAAIRGSLRRTPI